MKRNLTYLGGLAALFGLALAVSTYNVDTSEVLAGDTDTMTLTMSCTDPTQTAFVPDLTYVLSIDQGALAENPGDASHSVAATVLNGGVNGQVVGDITDETVVTDGETNATLEFWHSGPKIKTSGLACSANNSAALQSEISSTDANANFAVSFVGPAAVAYNATNKLDEAAINAIFGPTAPLIGASLADGSDSDAQQNGEVVYDGAQYRIANQFTYLGVADDADAENIVLKFTLD